MPSFSKRHYLNKILSREFVESSNTYRTESAECFVKKCEEVLLFLAKMQLTSCGILCLACTRIVTKHI